MKTSKKVALSCLSFLGAITVLSAPSLSEPPSGDIGALYMPRDWPITTVRKDKIYVIPGAASNATVIIGDRGVIVVDPKTTMATGQQLLKIIATLTPKPVTHVIETHSDCDHINGIVAFPKSVNIIAHIENLKEQEQLARLATIEIDGGHGVAPQDRLPNVVIKNNGETASIDGVHFVFYHFGPGHTGGDLMIYLPDEKVMIAGDIVMTSEISGPRVRDSGVVLKFEKNGSTSGLIQNLEGILATDAEVYISGHGDKVMTKAEVQELVDGFRAQMAKVDALAASGKSLEETTKEMGDSPVNMLANNIHPTTLKECPRGTINMTPSWIEWQEWTSHHRSLAEVSSDK